MARDARRPTTDMTGVRHDRRDGSEFSLHTRRYNDSMIALLGLDHLRAGIEMRGRLSLSGDALTAALRELHGRSGIDEIVILSTCNRTELYLATADSDAALNAARTYLETASSRAWLTNHPGVAVTSSELHTALYMRNGLEAVAHLHHVAAGLRSMVIGESQILGQTRDALANAEAAATCGEELRAAFTSALQVGKRVRAETGISRNDASVASVALHAARARIGALANKSVTLVGAGRTNELVAGLLRDAGVRALTIANRHLASAQALAARFGATAVALDAASDAIRDADLLMSATAAPYVVITPEMIAPREPSRPLLVVDLAVPADVARGVGELPWVTVINLDTLHDLPGNALDEPEFAGAVRSHQPDIDAAERIIEAMLREYTKARAVRLAAPGIAALRRHVDASQEQELARALAQLPNLSAEERTVVERFAARLVDKMFHHLVRRIRTLAEYDEIPPETTMRVLSQLFTRGAQDPSNNE